MSQGEAIPDERRKRLFVGLSVVLFFGTFSALWLTSRDYGFAIDEATYVWVAREGREWFAEIPSEGLVQSFSEGQLKRRWHFLEPPGATPDQPHSNFNLPVSHHLLNVGWLVGHWFLRDLDAHRMGIWLLFSLCVAVVFRTLAAERGVLIGVFAALLLLFSPRIFGHAHFAATDTPVACFWMLALCSLAKLERARDERGRRRAAVTFGVLVGLTFGVKLTGWFVALPAGIWLLSFRPPGWRLAIVSALLAVPLILYLATPPLWHAPVRGMVDYLRLTSKNPWKITTFYLGRGYQEGLPLVSPLVLLASTTPISILVLALLGGLTGLRDRLAVLFSLSLTTLLAFRAIGLMPVHDGERQFLAALYFLCPLAAIGFANVMRLLAWRFRVREWHPWGQRLVSGISLLIGLLLLIEPATDSWEYRAHGLSYYNRAVGGLPGAVDLGMEISYWFEGMTDQDWHDFLDDLPQGSKVFLLPDHPGVDYLMATGRWRSDLRSVGPDKADYLLLYAKRAAFVVRDPASGELKLTDLDLLRDQGPAAKEIRFLGVRFAALIPTRRRPGEPRSSNQPAGVKP